jgi:hypothetical protein
VGTHHYWRITHNNGSTSLLSTDFTSYEPPSITNLLPAYGAAGGGVSEGGFSTQGGEYIMIDGTNFGPSGTSISVSYVIPSAFGKLSLSLSLSICARMGVKKKNFIQPD